MLVPIRHLLTGFLARDARVRAAVATAPSSSFCRVSYYLLRRARRPPKPPGGLCAPTLPSSLAAPRGFRTCGPAAFQQVFLIVSSGTIVPRGVLRPVHDGTGIWNARFRGIREAGAGQDTTCGSIPSIFLWSLADRATKGSSTRRSSVPGKGSRSLPVTKTTNWRLVSPGQLSTTSHSAFASGAAVASSLSPDPSPPSSSSSTIRNTWGPRVQEGAASVGRRGVRENTYRRGRRGGGLQCAAGPGTRLLDAELGRAAALHRLHPADHLHQLLGIHPQLKQVV